MKALSLRRSTQPRRNSGEGSVGAGPDQAIAKGLIGASDESTRSLDETDVEVKK